MNKNCGMHIPGAMSADDWVAGGHKWKPDVHFICTDLIESRFVNQLVGECQGWIVAYSVIRDDLRCVHVELQFDTSEHAEEVRAVYEDAFTPSCRLKADVRAYFENRANLLLDDHGRQLRRPRKH